VKRLVVLGVLAVGLGAVPNASAARPTHVVCWNVRHHRRITTWYDVARPRHCNFHPRHQGKRSWVDVRGMHWHWHRRSARASAYYAGPQETVSIKLWRPRKGWSSHGKLRYFSRARFDTENDGLPGTTYVLDVPKRNAIKYKRLP
jgi:hypothetical protein